MVLCYSMMSYVDYSMMYHLIRGQSVIKLYIIYNMLEVRSDDQMTPLMFITLIVLISKSTNHLLLLLCCQVADRLFSSFGQDILDALYWTATEPKEKKRAHIGVIPHFLMAVLYVCILTEKDVIFINSLFILLLLCASVLKFRRHRGQKSPLELRQLVGGK